MDATTELDLRLGETWHQYKGTKEVYGFPMSRGDYNKYRGWNIPSNEDPLDEGYLVEYAKGGEPNDQRHRGYISWSPKNVFEEAYKIEKASTPQERVIQEQAELQIKLEALKKMLDKPKPNFLSQAQWDLMGEQHAYMWSYGNVLKKRIQLF